MTSAAARSSDLLSLVIPVYYNEENIPETWKAVEAALDGLPDDVRWEVVFVEDGSGDRSFERLRELQTRAPDRVTVVKLTRNFGQTSAILAGFQAARGDCCAVMSEAVQ